MSPVSTPTEVRKKETLNSKWAVQNSSRGLVDLWPSKESCWMLTSQV